MEQTEQESDRVIKKSYRARPCRIGQLSFSLYSTFLPALPARQTVVLLTTSEPQS